MANELWFHALKVLDGFRLSQDHDVSELYKFTDETGVLDRHREYLETVFKEKQADVKVVYFELIKMLLEQDRQVSPEKSTTTKEINKIQGFQVSCSYDAASRGELFQKFFRHEHNAVLSISYTRSSQTGCNST